MFVYHKDSWRCRSKGCVCQQQRLHLPEYMTFLCSEIFIIIFVLFFVYLLLHKVVTENLNWVTYLWHGCPLPCRVIIDGTFFLHLLLFCWFSMRIAIWDLIRANFWCFVGFRIVFGRRVGVSEKWINKIFCVRDINFCQCIYLKDRQTCTYHLPWYW